MPRGECAGGGTQVPLADRGTVVFSEPAPCSSGVIEPGVGRCDGRCPEPGEGRRWSARSPHAVGQVAFVAGRPSECQGHARHDRGPTRSAGRFGATSTLDEPTRRPAAAGRRRGRRFRTSTSTRTPQSLAASSRSGVASSGSTTRAFAPVAATTNAAERPSTSDPDSDVPRGVRRIPLRNRRRSSIVTMPRSTVTEVGRGIRRL